MTVLIMDNKRWLKNEESDFTTSVACKHTVTGRFCQGSQIRNKFRWKTNHVRIAIPDYTTQEIIPNPYLPIMYSSVQWLGYLCYNSHVDVTTPSNLADNIHHTHFPPSPITRQLPRTRIMMYYSTFEPPPSAILHHCFGTCLWDTPYED